MSQGAFTDEQVHIWLQEIADNAWVSLHFDTPALGGIGRNEISGGGYLRVKGKFTSPANRAIWSVDDVRWTGLTQTILTHYGVWNHPTHGMMRAYGRLPQKVSLLNGWGHLMRAGELAVSIG